VRKKYTQENRERERERERERMLSEIVLKNVEKQFDYTQMFLKTNGVLDKGCFKRNMQIDGSAPNFLTRITRPVYNRYQELWNTPYLMNKY
jgi:hypothetical protein